MVVIFVASGVLVLAVSARELVHKFVRRHKFERAEGVIVDVQSKTLRTTSMAGSVKSTTMHFPVVTFSTRSGPAVTFTSETGDAGSVSRYAPEQRLVVVYDPDGEFKPMIDTWSGMWLPNVMAVVARVGFVVGGILIGWLFRDRIFGR
jgi:hypothetical protein